MLFLARRRRGARPLLQRGSVSSKSRMQLLASSLTRGMNKDAFGRGRGAGGGPVGFALFGGGGPSSLSLTASPVGLLGSCTAGAPTGEALISVSGRLVAEEPFVTMARGAEAEGGDGFEAGVGFERVDLGTAAAAAAISFGGRMVGVKEGVLSGFALEGTTTVRMAGGAAERNDSAVTCEPSRGQRGSRQAARSALTSEKRLRLWESSSTRLHRAFCLSVMALPRTKSDERALVMATLRRPARSKRSARGRCTAT